MSSISVASSSSNEVTRGHGALSTGSPTTVILRGVPDMTSSLVSVFEPEEPWSVRVREGDHLIGDERGVGSLRGVSGARDDVDDLRVERRRGPLVLPDREDQVLVAPDDLHR